MEYRISYCYIVSVYDFMLITDIYDSIPTVYFMSSVKKMFGNKYKRKIMRAIFYF